MTIALSLNRPLGIRVLRVSERIAADEFLALAAFYDERPHLAHFDLINFIDADANPEITAADLVLLRQTFAQLQARVQPLLVRRSAWVCPNVRAWPLLEAWLHERHSRDGLHIEVCLVGELAEARCLFDAAELAGVADGADFEEIARFEPHYTR